MEVGEMQLQVNLVAEDILTQGAADDRLHECWDMMCSCKRFASLLL